MPSWKTLIFVIAAVLVAGYAIAQEQGPTRDSGPAVARPKRPAGSGSGAAAEEPELPKIPSRMKKENEVPADAPAFKSEVDIVTVDVAVLDNKGQFIPKVPAAAFRLLEDNVPQQVQKVEPGEAPMTIAMVIEFSNLHQQMWGAGWFQTLELAWGFADSLKPEDNCALVAFDIKPEILTDFTTDKMKLRAGLDRLKIAAWSETNLYDAITDTADRMKDIEGRKAILLIASGIDTFSKITFDKTRKSLQQSGVPIYSIGILKTLLEILDAQGRLGSSTRMDYLQAENALRTFSKETGGTAFFPRFEGEYPEIFQTIQQALRNQYVVTYTPTNKAHDGTFRKIKVELVDPATNKPIVVKDEKGKQIKYQVVAKAGYTAPRPVE